MSRYQSRYDAARLLRRAAVLGAAVLLTLPAAPKLLAHELNANGNKWPGGTTHIYTGIPGRSASGIRWQDALIDAAREWSEETVFDFDIRRGYRDPCAEDERNWGGDGLNGADFADDICGTEFGSALAVTFSYTRFNILGSAELVETDILFNNNRSMDIYDGPRRPVHAGFDFRRVALHELGHVIGLEHEEELPAIMAPNIGNLFRLQDDDIAGVAALYGGLDNCELRVLGFGRIQDRLDMGDCRVNELMVGGRDRSYVDVYVVDVADDVHVTVTMETDGLLDGVLLAMDPGLRLLQVDENSAGNCNPQLSGRLAPGRYVVLANTYTGGNAPCNERTYGEYQLTMTYESDDLLTLQGKESFQGGEADAHFFGGVTRDYGRTYHNRVRATDRFDVHGRIQVDPAHIGQPGYIVIAAIMEGETLMQNTRGDFVTYRPERELIPIAIDVPALSAMESVTVLRDMIAANIGIDQTLVDFYIGYGVHSNPTELYYHQQPINLIVDP